MPLVGAGGGASRALAVAVLTHDVLRRQLNEQLDRQRNDCQVVQLTEQREKVGQQVCRENRYNPAIPGIISL